MPNETDAVELTDSEEVAKPGLRRFVDLRPEMLADAEMRHTASTLGLALGPRVSLEGLARELDLFWATGIHVLHAQPGSGKTALCLQIAAECGCPAVFVSCEMSLTELVRRVIARTTQTKLSRLKSGELSPVKYAEAFEKAVAAVPNLMFVNAVAHGANPHWLSEALTAAKGSSNHLLVVLDSLHSWVSPLKPAGISEYDALNAGLRSVTEIALRLDCAFFVVAERNRQSAVTGGLNAARGTSRFEYAPETVIELERDLDDLPNPAGEVLVSLRVLKNRNGPVGSEVSLWFHGAFQRFRDRR